MDSKFPDRGGKNGEKEGIRPSRGGREGLGRYVVSAQVENSAGNPTGRKANSTWPCVGF
jgi:hypothetical protein